MKTLFIITVLSLFISCKKHKEDHCKANLAFNKITVSDKSSVATGIQFQAESYGPNLCYRFSRFVIQKAADKTYDIQAEATVPCKPVACAEALYYTSNTGKIEGLTAGTYTLRFQNSNGLFTTLSITIN